MSVKILTGDCRTVLRSMADESVHCIVTSPLVRASDFVQKLCVREANLHRFGQHGRSGGGTGVSSPARNLRNLALLFQFAKREAVQGLLAFDAKVRKQSTQAVRRLQISHLPRVQRSSLSGARVVNSQRSAERLFEQCRYIWCHLFEHQSLAEHGRSGIASNPHGIGGPLHGDAAVAVHCSGQVSISQGVGHER